MLTSDIALLLQWPGHFCLTCKTFRKDTDPGTGECPRCKTRREDAERQWAELEAGRYPQAPKPCTTGKASPPEVDSAGNCPKSKPQGKST
jgi:hypothetical protein